MSDSLQHLCSKVILKNDIFCESWRISHIKIYRNESINEYCKGSMEKIKKSDHYKLLEMMILFRQSESWLLCEFGTKALTKGRVPLYPFHYLMPGAKLTLIRPY